MSGTRMWRRGGDRGGNYLEYGVVGVVVVALGAVIATSGIGEQVALGVGGTIEQAFGEPTGEAPPDGGATDPAGDPDQVAAPGDVRDEDPAGGSDPDTGGLDLDDGSTVTLAAAGLDPDSAVTDPSAAMVAVPLPEPGALCQWDPRFCPEWRGEQELEPRYICHPQWLCTPQPVPWPQPVTCPDMDWCPDLPQPAPWPQPVTCPEMDWCPRLPSPPVRAYYPIQTQNEHPQYVAAQESMDQYGTRPVTSPWLPDADGTAAWAGGQHVDPQMARAHARFTAWDLDQRGDTGTAALLNHFLDGSGEPVNVDVELLLSEVPEFEEQVADHLDQIGESAVAQAEESGESQTYAVVTEWEPWGDDPVDPANSGGGVVYSDSDWAGALGEFHYSLVGEVSVSPPGEPGGDWTHEVDSVVSVREYYGWDRDSTDPVPDSWYARGFFSFSAQDMWELHENGMAREFWLGGSTGVSG